VVCGRGARSQHPRLSSRRPDPRPGAAGPPRKIPEPPSPIDPLANRGPSTARPRSAGLGRRGSGTSTNALAATGRGGDEVVGWPEPEPAIAAEDPRRSRGSGRSPRVRHASKSRGAWIDPRRSSRPAAPGDTPDPGGNGCRARPRRKRHCHPLSGPAARQPRGRQARSEARRKSSSRPAARRRSCSARRRLRSRIEVGVTSTSSSSEMNSMADSRVICRAGVSRSDSS
jgi:hypothetical protein